MSYLLGGGVPAFVALAAVPAERRRRRGDADARFVAPRRASRCICSTSTRQNEALFCAALVNAAAAAATSVVMLRARARARIVLRVARRRRPLAAAASLPLHFSRWPIFVLHNV